MYKLLKIFLLGILFYTGLFAQKANEICWVKTRKLTWEDYLAVPAVKVRGAVSYCGIDCAKSFNNDTLLVRINAVFNKQESWVVKGDMSNNLLIHEQGHFNLTELYARKFRKAVMELKVSKDKAQAYEEIKKLRPIFRDELSKRDAEYDKETDHSRNESKQIEWNKIITDEIAALEQFSSDQVKIVVR